MEALGFARSLVASGLIDEYRLIIHPVVLGLGQPLFSGLRSPVDLRLIGSTPFDAGVVVAVYQPARARRLQRIARPSGLRRPVPANGPASEARPLARCDPMITYSVRGHRINASDPVDMVSP